jgi:hypothetical protein
MRAPTRTMERPIARRMRRSSARITSREIRAWCASAWNRVARSAWTASM